jgi:formylglycine-generating enzyme required for sulfatase activity
MGSSDPNSNSDESPPHTVRIARPFAVSVFEITFDEWDGCVAHGACSYRGQDAGWGRGRQPAVMMSWNDARAYVSWLSKLTGASYRLLTEAEWEYAAKAGEVGETGLEEAAWHRSNSGGKPHPVGQKMRNAFGLYDMLGNVWEWVEDCYKDNYEEAPLDGSAVLRSNCNRRVIRGGSWDSVSADVRPSVRAQHLAFSRNHRNGLRVARTLPSLAERPEGGSR